MKDKVQKAEKPKKQYYKGEIFVKIMAGILAVMMVAAVATTLIVARINYKCNHCSVKPRKREIAVTYKRRNIKHYKQLKHKRRAPDDPHKSSCKPSKRKKLRHRTHRHYHA